MGRGGTGRDREADELLEGELEELVSMRFRIRYNEYRMDKEL